MTRQLEQLRKRLLWIPEKVRQGQQDEDIEGPWRRTVRRLSLVLLATILIICHPCHGEDIDDELRYRSINKLELIRDH